MSEYKESLLKTGKSYIMNISDEKSENELITKIKNQNEAIKKLKCKNNNEKLEKKVNRLSYFYANFCEELEKQNVTMGKIASSTFIEIQLCTLKIISTLIQDLNNANKNIATYSLLEKDEIIKNLSRKIVSPHKNSEEVKDLKIQLYQKSQKLEKIENNHNFIKTKLVSGISILSTKLDDICNETEIKKLQENINNLKENNQFLLKKISVDSLMQETIIAKLDLKLADLKAKNESLHKSSTHLETIIREFQFKIDNLQQDKKILIEKTNQLKEITLMQYEDYIGLAKNQEDYARFNDIIKNKNLDERINKEKANALNALLNDYNTFIIFKKIFSEHNERGRKLAHLKNSLNYHDFDSSVDDSNKLDNEYNLRNGFDLKKYTITRPSFDSFFDNDQLNAAPEPELTVEFIGTIRAIMDSKFNEFMLASDYRNLSRFPDFVYSWLGTFCLSKTTRKIRMLGMDDPDTAFLRIQVVKLMKNRKCFKIWDFLTFKEFLDEANSMDELIYYLQCRNFLFKGPQLNNQSTTFIYTHYVTTKQTELMLLHLLKDKYSEVEINEMLFKLRKKSEMKNGQLIMDSGLFLRILLEEYKREKREKLLKIKIKIENQLKKHGENALNNFDLFCEVLLFFMEKCQEIEKTEIYRKCWIVGNGNIDVDTLLIVLQDDNFLVKTNLFKTGVRFPDINSPINQNHICTKTFKSYLNIDSQMKNIANLTKTLGVESALHAFNELYVLLDQKFLSRPAILNGKNLQYFISCLMCKSFQLTGLSIFNTLENDDKLYEEMIIQANFKMIEEMYPYLSHFQEKLFFKDIEKQLKCKKLQRFFKKQLLGWSKSVSFILKDKFTKVIQLL